MDKELSTASRADEAVLLVGIPATWRGRSLPPATPSSSSQGYRAGAPSRVTSFLYSPGTFSRRMARGRLLGSHSLTSRIMCQKRCPRGSRKPRQRRPPEPFFLVSVKGWHGKPARSRSGAWPGHNALAASPCTAPTSSAPPKLRAYSCFAEGQISEANKQRPVYDAPPAAPPPAAPPPAVPSSVAVPSISTAARKPPMPAKSSPKVNDLW
mmetsp:Transcript_16812/g.34247  ORF Transcript_16812/g.34247 Transcript_16812/m.34247 type:complete len:210 (+) Transcript_16812:561-1190(+)